MIVDDDKKNLFQKFIRDESSPEEVEQLFQYLQNPKEDAAYKELMDQVWLKLEKYPMAGRKDKEEQFKIILDRNKKNGNANTRSVFGHYSIKLVAACIGFFFLSTLIYLLVFQSSVVTIQTKYGETKEITLPDGSTVMLNNNSKISYDRDWKARKVLMDGEAFFSVIHTEDDQKFIVKTADVVSIEVLGTRFNVNNRRNATEVVLNEGKVKVNINNKENENQEVLMKPGELVAYSQATHQYQKKLINTKTYTSWTDSVFIFEGQSLKEIAFTLEDNYGYIIRFADEKIGKYKFTGTIPTSKIDILFTMLSKSFDLKIERKGKKIWIKQNN